MHMERLNRLAAAANSLLMAFAGIIAAFLLLSGLYVLNDIYYTNRTAFVSYDLLKYRPEPHLQGKEEYDFSELRQINPDTVGWLEMFGTNINYPVMHGKDNLEYLNKDIFGYSTLSGSIYLAAENDSDFSNWYNLIYGHHMENGAMFGDIEKYLDHDYFSSHQEGILQTSEGDYIIKVFACIRTNAYEDAVYQISEDAESKYPVLRDYISQHAVIKEDIPDASDDMQIIGMSTCTDAVTDGRIVLFASVAPWDSSSDGNALERMASSEESDKPSITEMLTAIGHKTDGRKWALLNLMCVICTFLTLLPVWALRRKFGQLRYAKDTIDRLEDELEEDQNNKDVPDDGLPETEIPDEDAPDDDVADTSEDDEKDQIISDLKHFLRKSRIGILLEVLILLISVIAFLVTEDITGRMGIRDRWTGLMILIAAIALTADFICLRYRGIRPEDEPETEQENK